MAKAAMYLNEHPTFACTDKIELVARSYRTHVDELKLKPDGALYALYVCSLLKFGLLAASVAPGMTVKCLLCVLIVALAEACIAVFYHKSNRDAWDDKEKVANLRAKLRESKESNKDKIKEITRACTLACEKKESNEKTAGDEEADEEESAEKTAV